MSNKSATTTLSQAVINNGKIFSEGYSETASTYEVFRNRKNILLDSLSALATPQSKDVHLFHDGKIALTDVTVRARDVVEVNLDQDLGPTQRVFVELGPTGNIILNGKAEEVIYELQPAALTMNTGSYMNYTFKVIRDGVDVTSQITDWAFTAGDSMISVTPPSTWTPNSPQITAGYTAGTSSLTVSFTDFGKEQSFEVPITIQAVENFEVTLIDSDIGVNDSGWAWVQFKWKGDIIDDLSNASLGYSSDKTFITSISPNGRPVYDQDKQAWKYDIASGNREGNGWIIVSASRPDGVHGEAKLTILVNYKLLTITPDTYGNFPAENKIHLKFEAKLGDTLIESTRIKFTSLDYITTPLPGNSRYITIIGSYSSYPIYDGQAGRFYLNLAPTHIGGLFTWTFDCTIDGRSYRGVAGQTWTIDPAPIIATVISEEVSAGTSRHTATVMITQPTSVSLDRPFVAASWGNSPKVTAVRQSDVALLSTDTPGIYTYSYIPTYTGPVDYTNTAMVDENPGLATKNWDVSIHLLD